MKTARRQLKILLDSSARLATGDFSVRTGLPPGKGEWSRLTCSFDQMAQSLESREAERERTERALHDSEVRYRRLFETAQDGILILNAETGQIDDVNPFLTRLLGYSRKQLLGHKLWEIGPFKDIPASKAEFRELQREDYVRYHDLPLETKDGRSVSVEFVSNVYLVNDRKVIQCNIRDITGHKLTAKRSQESSRRRAARHALARATAAGPTGQLAGLRARLAVAEETLRAIRSGEVDSVMVAGKEGSQVFTLQGAEHAYRVLIESMNEGALTLTTDQMILYANQCFAKMVKLPLEQVIGTSFRSFLAVKDRAPLRALLKRAAKAGAKIQMVLHTGSGSQLPVLISIRPLARNGSEVATVGMVVTDMTEARRNEELLRALTHRVVQAQEAERGRVALELHDHITQLLCAVLVRSQVLADKLSTHNGPAQNEAIALREMLGHTAEEVERISRNLRPSVLDELGLAPVLRSDSAEFAERTGVSLKVTCVELTARLPGEDELAFYRILQEALKNVEQHARARHVTVCLTQPGAFVEMVIHDDGIGFDPGQRPSGRKTKRGFGLLSMRERAAGVGGILSVKSAVGKGTTICAQIPLRKVRGGGNR